MTINYIDKSEIYRKMDDSYLYFKSNYEEIFNSVIILYIKSIKMF